MIQKCSIQNSWSSIHDRESVVKKRLAGRVPYSISAVISQYQSSSAVHAQSRYANCASPAKQWSFEDSEPFLVSTVQCPCSHFDQKGVFWQHLSFHNIPVVSEDKGSPKRKCIWPDMHYGRWSPDTQVVSSSCCWTTVSAVLISWQPLISMQVGSLLLHQHSRLELSALLCR